MGSDGSQVIVADADLFDRPQQLRLNLIRIDT